MESKNYIEKKSNLHNILPKGYIRCVQVGWNIIPKSKSAWLSTLNQSIEVDWFASINCFDLEEKEIFGMCIFLIVKIKAACQS